MAREAALGALFASDRRRVLVGLGVIVALAWAYLLYMGWGMEHMDAGAAMSIMPHMISWNARDLALVFVMWAIMMAAMMLPSAAPMVLMFATLNRHRRDHEQTVVPVSAFVGGYLAIWTAFSGLATFAQWGLLEASLVTPMMASTSDLLGGGLLIAAGIFQFTSLKHACLAKCRSPLAFIMTEWRDGTGGALVMGLRHGAYCTGCCWLLMALLFVFGVMNLIWIALLSAFVLIEKLLPRARWLSPGSGVLLIAWGVINIAGFGFQV